MGVFIWGDGMDKNILKRIFLGIVAAILVFMLLLVIVFFSLMILESKDPRKVEEDTLEEVPVLPLAEII